MLGVIDYKAGNAPSVLNALRYLGHDAALVSSAEGLSACASLILPGVGSADATMDSLNALGLSAAIRTHVGADKPFLGVCVGAQVLFERSEEGDTPCFGFLPGRVRLFAPERGRVPQMGWNAVRFTRADSICAGMEEAYFYFVNSYYMDPSEKSLILGAADYGGSFCALTARGKLYGAQFHVEKSAEAGLMMLDAFARLNANRKEGASC